AGADPAAPRLPQAREGRHAPSTTRLSLSDLRPFAPPRSMLFTFHVSARSRSSVTQHHAADWVGPREALIGSAAFREFTEATLPSAADAPLTAEDTFLMIPMTGLKHCWLIQGGRAGQYFTAIVIQTDDTGEVEDPCPPTCRQGEP